MPTKILPAKSARQRACFWSLGAGLVLLLCAACSGKPSPEAPETALLEKRATALITLGWKWLHAEKMVITRQSELDGRYTALCQYDVVLEADVSALPQEEQERYRNFLPLCAENTLVLGERCHVSESMNFVFTEEFGWMPEPAVLYAPNLLPDIAVWTFQPSGI